jgi:hypothetical protein
MGFVVDQPHVSEMQFAIHSDFLLVCGSQARHNATRKEREIFSNNVRVG